MPLLQEKICSNHLMRAKHRKGPKIALMRAALTGLFMVASLGHATAQVSLNPMLKVEAEQAGFPALAAAVVSKGKLVATGVAGTRRAGTLIPVEANDRFHIGSDTKAMTSLLAAMLIEEGKLDWNTPLAEVFPELAASMDMGVRRVTMEQLMSHSSGFPADTPAFVDLIAKATVQPGNLDAQRYWLFEQVASQPLSSEPGSSFAYSNLGYTVLGTVIERRAGKSWEELITERIFNPLGLSTAGIGPQASLGRIDAPLGHNIVDGKNIAVLSGPQADNPLVIGPAGTVHLSVQDFARWGGWMAGLGKRPPYLAKPETLKRLIKPVIATTAAATAATTVAGGAEYAMGWGSINVPWTTYPLPFHGGSNGMNKAYIWIDTQRDAAIVVMTNVAAPNSDAVTLALGGKLYARFIAPRK